MLGSYVKRYLNTQNKGRKTGSNTAKYSFARGNLHLVTFFSVLSMVEDLVDNWKTVEGSSSF